MHTHSSQSSARVVLAVVIAVAHIAAGAALMNLRNRAPLAELQKPVDVRFISESPVRPQWQPPEVTPVQPQIDTRVPVIPVIEIPVSPEPSHAITAQVVAAITPAPPQASEPAKLIASVEYLREPAPRYPPQSRKLREQGLVVLRVVIDERGTACDVSIENSSGHERLDRAAREAIARAEFRPYLEDGVARRAMVLIPIEFSLNTRIASNGA